LNQYIQELVRKNEQLQDHSNDMKTTLIQNKLLLGIIKSIYLLIDDYINSVGQSDQLVQKLKKEIDSLRKQVYEKDEQLLM
jgi:hypothetical protein